MRLWDRLKMLPKGRGWTVPAALEPLPCRDDGPVSGVPRAASAAVEEDRPAPLQRVEHLPRDGDLQPRAVADHVGNLPRQRRPGGVAIQPPLDLPAQFALFGTPGARRDDWRAGARRLAGALRAGRCQAPLAGAGGGVIRI